MEGTPTVQEAERFLFAEARLLDERRFEEWESLFTDDAVYWVPIDPGRDPSHAVAIIYDDRKRLHERVYRLTQTPVLDQNPASRTIRAKRATWAEIPGISAITITAGPLPATYTRLVRPSSVMLRFSKSASSSRSVIFGVEVL